VTKSKYRIDKVIFSAVLLLIGLLFLILTMPLGRMAQWVPIRVLLPTIVLLLLQLRIDWHARGKRHASDVRGRPGPDALRDGHFGKTSPASWSNLSGAMGKEVKAYPILLLLVFLPVSIYLMGFILSATLFVWLYYRLYFKKPFLISASLSFGAAIFLYLLLVLLLGMDLQAGLIWNLPAVVL
jgi:hypothetical protein